VQTPEGEKWKACSEHLGKLDTGKHSAFDKLKPGRVEG
jgi:hypothetical protein